MTHRLWLPELPSKTSLIAFELLLGADLDVQFRAARRLWLTLGKRTLIRSRPTLSLAQRQRFTLAIRALDGYLEGNSNRTIAEVLFGAARVSEQGWKTHDLRSRTKRLIRFGLSLMRGGYRALLRDQPN